jgi:hypothetical protein
MTSQPAAPTTCECGDPSCTYVANLNVAMAWMQETTRSILAAHAGAAALRPDEH